jgi:tripartite-type tricarboxylate transporter receptor subunit TctC
MNRLRTAAAAGIALAALVVTGHDAHSQTSRTIRIIVPTPPAGGSDIVARQLGDEIARRRGVTVVVENRPGGGNVIGFEAASRAEPDGNNLLLITNAFLVIPNVRKLSYDTFTGFAPICYLTSSPSLIAVNTASPYRTLTDLVNAARAKPGELTMASVGPVNPYHIGIEQLKKAAGINITYVPFPGAGPAVNQLLGQHVTSFMGSLSNISGQLRGGLLRALAVGTPKRIAALPDVPTMAETYKDFEIDVWFGVVAPGKTPKPALTELIGWFTEAMRSPDIVAKFDTQGLYPAVTCGEDFTAIMRRQYDEYGRIIRESNIKAE